MGQALLVALVESQTLKPEQILVHNRSPGKVEKMKARFPVQGAETPEALVEQSHVVILATKPQDLLPLLEPLGKTFSGDKVAISLAAGVQLTTLRKYLPEALLVRVMANTPIFICKAVIGFCLLKPNGLLEDLVEQLFSPLGYVVSAQEGEPFSALMVASSSGTGFVLELMKYWQDWIEENGIDPQVARKIVIETFMGAAQMAAHRPELSFDQQTMRVASKKGVTEAGLTSLRELELEGILRMSFNRALMRDHELAQENS